ncbi:hypothetical protein MSWAN_1640 [Methanobacterium paludis]|uniref:Uncharacterized protein n=1 Tax=Methanobacterium paludis (strain DSM 25820 / JCM 18151 / SWAN1) TaxID=868131 RepID=F6D2S2_METPW|nr:hypothetical protein MSWAN_1640 [Methanobacterium paludis]
MINMGKMIISFRPNNILYSQRLNDGTKGIYMSKDTLTFLNKNK